MGEDNKISDFWNQWKKRLLYASSTVPLIMMLVAGAMWLDARYMHKQLSDVRYLELQIRINEMEVSDLEDRIDAGEQLTSEEKRLYDIYIGQIETLMKERNRQLGISE